MKSGMLIIFHNFESRKSDAQTYRDCVALAETAEPLGFDFLMATEHHFTDYSMCPDNVDFLCFMAARTTRIKLGPGAIIVPWNDPLRSASKMVMLDHLSQGRALLGLGRGLARIEYELFDLDMSNTRAQFDEGARMIKRALETGYIESDGPMYHQKRAPIRPAPFSTDWSDRTFCVGMSPDSVIEAARIGARLMSFSNVPWQVFRTKSLAPYLEAYEQCHGKTPPPIVTGDLVIVHEDAERAEELARIHFTNYLHSVLAFYELGGDHFARAKGYETYALEAEKIAAVDSRKKMEEAYLSGNLYGTPAQVAEKIAARREILGHPFDVCAIFEPGGIALRDMLESARLFGTEVQPMIEGL
jgi:alkanesulfonate monooxygenase SsuD/methylene tetrahydromethanopterin reductase-like flavin-dependent oxidoreductase (luciferase family)